MTTDKANLPLKESSRQVQDGEEHIQFFQLVIGTLFALIKEFSLDLKEIDADGFKAGVDKLTEKILSEEKIKKAQSFFEKHKKSIYLFIERLKKYLSERENEFKGIIDLLTKGMATLDEDNRIFNQKIYGQSEKIEQITFLDDIKKIKSALKQEIEHVRKTVKEKQKQDKQYMEQLSKKVDILNVELERAVAESQRDGLTGAFNRLAFDRYIIDLVSRNIISDAPFSLLLLDIDDFKYINDTYGHPIGDRVILALVQKCREITRKDDFIARFGGDEFAIIMPGASLRNATKKAKQLSKQIAGTRYALNTSEDSLELSFSVSIGVSAYGKGDTTAAVTERADRALYSAKESGKARVISEKDLR